MREFNFAMKCLKKISLLTVQALENKNKQSAMKQMSKEQSKRVEEYYSCVGLNFLSMIVPSVIWEQCQPLSILTQLNFVYHR